MLESRYNLVSVLTVELIIILFTHMYNPIKLSLGGAFGNTFQFGDQYFSLNRFEILDVSEGFIRDKDNSFLLTPESVLLLNTKGGNDFFVLVHLCHYVFIGCDTACICKVWS